MNRKYKIFFSTFILPLMVMVFFAFSDVLKSEEVENSAPENMFLGSGTCASSVCHGTADARDVAGLKVNQNEFTIWFFNDSHRKAYDTLKKPISKTIARNIGLGKPAHESQKCLSCHSTNPPSGLASDSFDITEGVGCESCHGPSGNWQKLHTSKEWNEDKYAEYGMYDTDTYSNRAKKCINCHVGNKSKFVDHELIAAGHPDLNTFEFNTFIANMPPHWRESDDEKREWQETELWMTGQVETLKQNLTNLADRASGNKWPEFSEFNCFSCHHDLTDEGSWRQQYGYPYRTAGYPLWNSYRYASIKPLSKAISSDIHNSLTPEINRLKRNMDKFGIYNKSQIAKTANSIVNQLNSLSAKIEDKRANDKITKTLLLNITSDADSISKDGIRAAQISAVSLDSLFYKYRINKDLKNEELITKEIESLLNYLEKPATYKPSVFKQKMAKINRLIKNSG